MKKHLFVYPLLLLSFSTVYAQTAASDWFSIKGFLPQWNKAVIELIVEGKLIRKDTVQKDMYSFTAKTTGVKEAQLKIIKNKKPYYFTLFIEPGTIRIRDEKQQLVAFGTPINESYKTVIKQIDSLALLQSQLRFAEIRSYKRDLAVDYIKLNPSSLISIKLLADYFYLDASSSDTLYYQLYHALDSEIKNSYTGKKLLPDLEQRYRTAKGRPIPITQLPDVNNELFPIFEKGKYTLLNFWASWCLPCKREHPRLSQLYNQYNAQGFTIVSISLDNNRSAWVNGIKTEKLEWRQLSDLKGFKSPVASLFGAKLIPYNILLDPNGIIIGKNQTIDEIEHILTKKAGFSGFVGPF